MRKITSLALCLAALFMVAVPAWADIAPQVGDKLYFTDYMSGQKGGSLIANPTAGSVFDPFKTFCVEIEEYIWVGGGANFQYQIDNIGLETNSGGKTLTEETAWLFTVFTNGTLNSYNDSKVKDRNALQYGIWSALGYTDQELLARFGSRFQSTIDRYNSKPWETDFTDSSWSGLGNVRIANLVWGNSHKGRDPGHRAQDQLVMTVPAPGAALLGVIGFGLVGRVKRRFG